MSADTSHTSEDFSDIDMDELDSYLTSPPVRSADPPCSRDERVARSASSSPSPRKTRSARPRTFFQIVPLVLARASRLTVDARPSPLHLPHDERRR